LAGRARARRSGCDGVWPAQRATRECARFRRRYQRRWRDLRAPKRHVQFFPSRLRGGAGARAGGSSDAGGKLRVVVYGQEGLTNTYTIDAAGSITMPLIGQVPARGRSPAALANQISAKLRNGYIREPSVAVEIESYRPFFILGEVQAPGQYPYVPNMTVESAVAIAGGFS